MKGQDIIVKVDGTTILSKVLEINVDNVKYKKFKNINGPSYTISIEDILAINYENGEKEDFKNKRINSDSRKDVNSQTYIKKNGDKRNSEIISSYNIEYDLNYKIIKNIKNKNKNTNKYILIFGVTSSSIMSNNDIEFTLERRVKNVFGFPNVIYNINLKNKTNKTIYIDKGNCFKIFYDGSSFCYYSNKEQLTVSKGGGSGGSLGLGSVAGILGVGGVAGQLAGGVSVSGGSTHSVSQTYSQHRIIAIPPHSYKNLVDEKFVEIKGAKFGSGRAVWQTYEYAESFDYDVLKMNELGWAGGNDKAVLEDRAYYDPLLNSGLVRIGETAKFDENNSPFKQTYLITYSFNEDFRDYSSLQANIFLRNIVGVEQYRKKNTVFSSPNLMDMYYILGINDHTLEGFYTAK